MIWQFYLKTTETCNLNCKHCFTNGTNGAKVYWNYKKVAEWLKTFYSHSDVNDSAHCEFHGGEPFLAPIEEMQYVYDECKNLWPNTSWGITSNLVLKLTQQHIDFIKGPLGGRIGTSWDPKIRFANDKQSDLWYKNVKTLISEGIDIKLFVSVTKDTINIEPIMLLNWIKSLGIKEVSFERLTNNGNAKQFPEIFPSNVEQDLWFLKMHEQTALYEARDWFHNEFLESVYDKFESNYTKAGTFCRDCEEKIFTLNADGGISGCPNAAPEFQFGTIYDDIKELLFSPKRLENISCERSRNVECYSCEVFEYCGGDCHQLEWQNGICGAPKSLMKLLKPNKKYKVWTINELVPNITS
jgi:radical SAM protein with 4Fe4S-binding SPASM domain